MGCGSRRSLVRRRIRSMYLLHQRIEHTHPMALVHQPIHEVRTDKSSATRHQHISFFQLRVPRFPGYPRQRERSRRAALT